MKLKANKYFLPEHTDWMWKEFCAKRGMKPASLVRVMIDAQLLEKTDYSKEYEAFRQAKAKRGTADLMKSVERRRKVRN